MMSQELDKLRSEADTFAPQPDPAFKTILPLNDLHRRIFRAQAALWRAQGLDSVMLWQTPQWDYLPLIAKPSSGHPVEISIHALRGERRSGAFNLSNAAAEDAILSLRIEGLPQGRNPGRASNPRL